MKYGIEFEFFVSKDTKIIPAYLATKNLDGNPFLGEIKTEPFDSIAECVFNLEKLIYLEQQELAAKGFRMEIIPQNLFSKEDLITFRKNAQAVNQKDIEVLEEFSIYPSGKLSKFLKRGEIKASLQINMSQHKTFTYPIYSKISVENKSKYELSSKEKEYSCLFNYNEIIKKLDEFFIEDITNTRRIKGVYAIKPGTFGDRIEYRSLPNTITYRNLIPILT